MTKEQSDENKDRNVGFRVTSEQFVILREQAFKSRKSLSQMCREMMLGTSEVTFQKGGGRTNKQ